MLMSYWSSDVCSSDLNVALGAHPGLPDLAGFGRRNMDLTPQSAYDLVAGQVGAMAAVAASQGGRLNHVKAHGALYNLAVKNPELARALAHAVSDLGPGMILFGLASITLVEVTRDFGVTVAEDVFDDRPSQNN